MSENNDKSNNKNDCKTDDFYVIKAVAISLVGMLVLPFFISCFNKMMNNNDGEYFSINTLSSEELEGKSYTERTTYDDSDLWETEDTEKIQTTVVVDTTAELTYLKDIVKFPIDINLATVEELMLIDGIGSVTADKIITYRNMYGYYTDYRQLLNIDGIGEKKLAHIMECIYISDEWLEISTTSVSDFIETSVVTAVPITQKEILETVTVSKAATEESEIVIVNEEFETYHEENVSEYEFDFTFESITTTEYVEFPLELNSATIDELIHIEGIGEYIAQNIVNYARNYGFYSVEDLLNVEGIGNSKLAVILPYVYVDTYLLPPQEETLFTFTEIETTTEIVIPRVNVNICEKYELMQLPGIDEELAERIIDFRDTIGGYLKIEELILVDGMTNEKLSAILDYVYI